jgi:hypothetical protein
MEKYHKFIGGIILLAFFAALSFYTQKAALALCCFVENYGLIEHLDNGVAKTAFTLVINFIR